MPCTAGHTVGHQHNVQHVHQEAKQPGNVLHYASIWVCQVIWHDRQLAHLTLAWRQLIDFRYT